MVSKEEIYEFVKNNGPVLTTTIVKEFRLNSVYAGAYLAELVSDKKIKVSNIRSGTSPVYYHDGQESSLVNFFSYLPAEERDSLSQLFQTRILEDVSLSTQAKITMRRFKEFAVPLGVTVDNKHHLFWKWNTLQDQEAEAMIRQYMQIPSEKTIPSIPSPPQEKQTVSLDWQKKFEELAVSHKSLKGELESLKKTKKITEASRNFKEEGQMTLTDTHQQFIAEPHEFTKRLHGFFKERSIAILEYTVIKAGEIDLLVSLPTALGGTTYYCKAKDRKRIGEGDLSSALLCGQLKHLPTAFITTGALSKKTEEMMDKQFQSLLFKRL